MRKRRRTRTSQAPCVRPLIAPHRKIAPTTRTALPAESAAAGSGGSRVPNGISTGSAALEARTHQPRSLLAADVFQSRKRVAPLGRFSRRLRQQFGYAAENGRQLL